MTRPFAPRLAVAFFVLFSGFAAPANADSYQAGLEAYKRGDYAAAHREWLPLAQQGDADAQNGLGVMYASGEGVPEDDRETVKLIRRAAEQGNATAQNILGWMYSGGRGVPEDDREAVKWFRRAAEQGDARAQFSLGLMYDNGEGVPEDDREAVKWFRRAAEQGDARAQFNLGVMYANGEGAPEDDREAVKWFRRAAEQGITSAQFNLGVMYDIGEGVPEDDREAVKWFRRAAEQGDAGAQNNLGLMYDNGKGVPEDDREAVKWLRRAAEQGNASAQFNLGLMYDNGEGVPEDYVRAYAWTNLAAAQGHDGADKNKDSLRRRMTSSQIARAQELSHALQRRIEGRTGSGSGFFVDARGHVLTNRHVVDGCARLTVAFGSEERDAALRAVSEADDLALLSTGRRGTVGARFRSTRARHGETVAVAGFPLGGLLTDDLHVTDGSVSALAGAGDDPRLVQITAPVQPGNSGGPLLDAGGRAIGVVVSRLDALKMAMLSAAAPQNVNFAIKGTVARSFLDIHGIDYAAAGPGKAISGEAVARRARRFTVSVACWN